VCSPTLVCSHGIVVAAGNVRKVRSRDGDWSNRNDEALSLALVGFESNVTRVRKHGDGLSSALRVHSFIFPVCPFIQSKPFIFQGNLKQKSFEEWRLLGCYAFWLLLEPTFWGT
jgi:hypothetical protein